jgi:elongation of very long chain fatty acids protein 4
MAQFVFALIMGVNAIFIGCDFPMWMQYSMVLYMVSFLVLFSRYFYYEYLVRNEKKQKTF